VENDIDKGVGFAPTKTEVLIEPISPEKNDSE
jgi:hypothetical protein